MGRGELSKPERTVHSGTRQVGSSLVAWWSGFGAFTLVAQVQSLAWELRSHTKLRHMTAKERRETLTASTPSCGHLLKRSILKMLSDAITSSKLF